MRAEDKKALRAWEEFHKAFAQAVDIDPTLSSADIDRKRRELEADPVAWCRYFFPTYAKAEFAPFHIQAIKRIVSNPEWYEVLSWSRELAKSTVVMMVMMYLILTRRKRFVVLAAATEKAAIRLLTPYRISLEKNPRLIQFYGEQMMIGAWQAEDFTLRNGARLVGLGAGSAPRGVRNEEVRPDVILCDDYDTDEDCRNPETLKKKWDWFNEALYPTRSISEPLLVVWCGNIIARDCCITRAGAQANSWDIVNIRDKQGKSSWAAKNTEEMIDRVLSKIPMSSQQKEYYNNPVIEGKFFKNLPYGRIPPLRKFSHLIIYGDPAYSDRKSKAGSYKGVWLIGLYKGVYYIIKGFLDKATNAEFISWYFELVEYVGGKTNIYLYMENNKLQDPFYEQVFIPLLREENSRRGKSLHIRGDERKKTDKATRIESNLEPIDRLGGWIFNVDEEDNPHMKQLRDQFALFELHLPYPADGPDTIEGGITLLKSKSLEYTPPVTISYHEINSDNPHRL